jgi:hypothetical protein
MKAKNGREQDGRVRRNLSRIIVAIELVRSEEGRGFIYTWGARATPFGPPPSVIHQAIMRISRRVAHHLV